MGRKVRDSLLTVLNQHLTSFVSETLVLEDDDGVVVGALVGFPKGETYAADVEEFVEVVTQAGKEMRFCKAENSRGGFNTIAVGVSYGGGQMVFPLSSSLSLLKLNTSRSLVTFDTPNIIWRSLTSSLPRRR